MSDHENMTSDRIRQQAMVRNPIIKIEPQECLNCGNWREVDENYMVEKCKLCGDEEYYYFEGYDPEIA